MDYDKRQIPTLNQMTLFLLIIKAKKLLSTARFRRVPIARISPIILFFFIEKLAISSNNHYFCKK